MIATDERLCPIKNTYVQNIHLIFSNKSLQNKNAFSGHLVGVLPGGVCLGGGGCPPMVGVCLGCLLGGGGLPRRVHPHCILGYTSPLVNRMTHRSKNITLPQNFVCRWYT